jgi:hypothetical protein
MGESVGLVATRGVLGRIALLGLMALGCSGPHGPPPPATYAVNGKVQYKGGRAFAGGIIQFLSAAEPTLTMTGEIAEDGTFEVQTLFFGKRLPGAVAGPCQVLVSPPITANKPVPIYRPAATFHIKAEANYLTIEVD